MSAHPGRGEAVAFARLAARRERRVDLDRQSPSTLRAQRRSVRGRRRLPVLLRRADIAFERETRRFLGTRLLDPRAIAIASGAFFCSRRTKISPRWICTSSGFSSSALRMLCSAAAGPCWSCAQPPAEAEASPATASWPPAFRRSRWPDSRLRTGAARGRGHRAVRGCSGTAVTAFWATVAACLASFAARYISIMEQSRLPRRSDWLRSPCSAAATASSLDAPRAAASSARASKAGPFFGFVASSFSNRLRASSGFLSAMSSVARLTAAAK